MPLLPDKGDRFSVRKKGTLGLSRTKVGMMNTTGSDADAGNPLFGERLKSLRKSKRLTLSALSKLSGVSVSTISKVENGAASPSYDVILKISYGLDVSISELAEQKSSPKAQKSNPRGWQVIGRKGESDHIEVQNYSQGYLCSVLKKKVMVPILVDLKARSLKEFGDLISHQGEEFLFVLKGKVRLHSEHYRSAELNEGDYAYIDSTMGHAYVSASEEDAQILCICTGLLNNAEEN